ncbi:hypothetical protein OFO03_00960 [Campylobacter sp. JMF_02 ED1]|uniref:hypothetical protein n=2 Tax=Campylobacter TaxID=194 RepID=UPI0022E9AD0D|nr:hypothetical protein [Campylobacter sp. JMF_02 ED1]MDA3050477.1 hypothetical protein [Campylobacter sp. JMF_02 ED1]
MENKNLEQNSKNNNLRDYDKEPLIIKDYNQEVTNFWSLFVFIFVLIAIVFSKNKMVILPFMIWALKSQNQYKNAEFKFTNSTILHKSPKFIKEIGIARIEKIQKTMQILYEIHNEKIENKFLKYFVNIFLILWFLGICFVTIVIENQGMPLLLIFCIFCFGLFIPQLLYHFKKDNKFVDLYDTIIIKSDDDIKICIFCAKKDDYEEIRKYVLFKKGIDINKVEKILL